MNKTFVIYHVAHMTHECSTHSNHSVSGLKKCAKGEVNNNDER